MSDLKNFEREIAETDAFIAAIAPEGKALVTAIRETGFTLALREPDMPPAYVKATTNTLHGSTGMPLAERFNRRVHEGIHALQLRNAPSVAAALSNLESGAAGPVLSPQAAMLARSLAETGAHAMQAKFNALAVRETGIRDFVTCFPNSDSASFVALQLDLIDRGCDPEDIRNEIAQRFLSLETPSWLLSLVFPKMAEHLKVSWQENFDAMTLDAYWRALDAHGGTIARGRLAELTTEDRARLLDAFEPLGCTLELLERFDGAYDVSEDNRDLLSQLAPKLV